MEESPGLLRGEDGKLRCKWHGNDPEYLAYHDHEWGYPVTDDTRLFEKICLEGFQAGLSWLTILRKRENFRQAFHGFEIDRVAGMVERDIERLLGDKGIVRHRGKITSTINNAKCALKLIADHGSLKNYFWSYETAADQRPNVISWEWLVENPVSSASIALSKDLKKQGFSFVGPTTIYAFMQAMGLVNDHVEGCYCRQKAKIEREKLKF